MTLQTRSRYNDGHWSPWADRAETVLDFHHQMAVVRQTEVREKPGFEPGYFVLVQDVRADGAPWLVKWFDENPGNDWDRAVIVNDNLVGFEA